MDYNEFHQSLSSVAPPANLSPYLLALWYDANGDWERSHSIIQEINDNTSAWIHAYLHRKEGDTGNADYWYRRADKRRPAITLQQEWEELVKSLL